MADSAYIALVYRDCAEALHGFGGADEAVNGGGENSAARLH